MIKAIAAVILFAMVLIPPVLVIIAIINGTLKVAW